MSDETSRVHALERALSRIKEIAINRRTYTLPRDHIADLEDDQKRIADICNKELSQ